MQFSLTNLADITRELKRELATRQKVYPDWIKSRRLSKEVAGQRMTWMENAIIVVNKYHRIVDYFVKNSERIKKIKLYNDTAYSESTECTIVTIVEIALRIIEENKAR